MAIDVKRGIRRLLIVLSVGYWAMAIYSAGLAYQASMDHSEMEHSRSYYGGVESPGSVLARYQIYTGFARQDAIATLFMFAGVYALVAGIGAGGFWVWHGFKGKPS